MFSLQLCVLAVCFLYTSGTYLNAEEFPIHRQQLTTPENLGQYLQEQLVKNESRFISNQCYNHLVEYAKGLISLKSWAIKMFDANAKFPAGFLRGNGGTLGSFDECLNVESNTETSVGVIHGKYCLGQLILLNFNPESRIIEGATVATEQGIEQRLVDLGKKSMGLGWGVCLPDACSAEDYRLLHLTFIRFSEDECQTKSSQSIEFDNGDKAAIAFLGVIAALVIISTAYDVYVHYKLKDEGIPLLRSFSIVTNGSKIITIQQNQEFSCLYGIRAITLLMFTAGYRYGLHLFAPLNNWLDMFKWIINNAGFFEAVVIADTFFVLSGMLVSYNYLNARAKGVKFNLLTFYLNRIIRLTPPLAVVILINATLLRHIGSGPVWPRARDLFLVKNCRDYWWSVMLYIQNYVNPGFAKLCILPTWQLSADMQFFILSPLVLIPLTTLPKYTIIFISCCLFFSMLSAFLTAWVYKLKSVIVTFRSIADISGYIHYFYFPTHTRAAPWIIGLILGYIIFESKKNKLRAPIPKNILSIIIMILWVTALTGIVMCVAIGSEINASEYNWIPHAFHMALVRPVWAVAISWIIFACVHGYGGYINSILSMSVFQIISRISYSTYLVTFTLMYLLTYQTRLGLEFSDITSVNRFCGDIILCLSLGFLWNIAFESPFINIAKIMFGKLKRKKIKV